jgi:predicted transcriptional regulator
MSEEELLFELLANKYSRAILSLTSIKECSAIQLSQELDIPLATVYRKLKLLESTGLIQHVKTIINLQGNEEKYYRCAIREATVHINEGDLSLDLKKEDHSEKITRLWKRLAHPDNEDTGQN